MGLIPGLGRSPHRENGNPLQYSCWKFHGQRNLAGYSPGITKSGTRLSTRHKIASSQSRDIANTVQDLLLFRRSVMSDSLQPQGLQHAMFLWPSLFPEAYANSRPLSQWCHLVLSCPLLLLPSVFPRIRVFSNKSVLHIRWPKYWSFSFSISPSDEYSGLIYFRIDWFDLAVQGTLRSLLQYHSSMASILWCSDTG